MSKPYYKIQYKSEIEADVLIYGVIGDSWFEESITAKRFVSEFKELEKTCSRVNIHINSPGGSVFDGLAIFNAIQQSKVQIHTYNDGLAASMGAIILLSGGTVHSAKNALVMLHSPMGGVYGTEKDIQNYLSVLEKVKGSLVSCISSKSGAKPEDIEKKYFDFADHWLTAEEAKNEGFIDEIESNEAKVPENVSSMSYTDIVNEFDSLMRSPRRVNILSWFNNLFDKKENEMNLSELIKVCNLDSNSTEADVIVFVQTLVSNSTELETVRNDLETERDSHAETKNQLDEAKKQIENLKKAPGDKTIDVTKKTDDDSSRVTSDRLSKDDIELFKNI